MSFFYELSIALESDDRSRGRSIDPQLNGPSTANQIIAGPANAKCPKFFVSLQSLALEGLKLFVT